MSYAALVTRKRGTLPGDVVLVHYQDRPASFARVEDIRPHGRPGWFLCDLLVLTLPSQPVTWILERSQIDGAEFTMGGQPVRLERLPDLGAVHEQRRAEAPSTGSKGTEASSTGSKPKEAPAAEKPAASAKPSRSRRSSGERAGNVVRLFPRRP